MKVSIAIVSLLLIGVWIAACSSEAKQGVAQQKQRNEKKTTTERITVNKDGEVSSATIAQGRDLQLYDQAGHFNCRRWTTTVSKDPHETKKRIEESYAVARNFIWEHWQNKKRGYLRLTADSVDAAATLHIFIEPDITGRWQIVRRIARVHAMMPSTVDESPIIRVVERKPKVNGNDELIFKDVNGKEQYIFW